MRGVRAPSRSTSVGPLYHLNKGEFVGSARARFTPSMAATGTNAVFLGWNPDWTRNGFSKAQISSYRAFDHST